MYTADDWLVTRRKKRRLYIIILITSVILLSAVILIGIYLSQWATYVATVVMASILFFIWDANVQWVRHYERFLKELNSALSQPCQGEVVSFSKHILYREKIAVYLLEIQSEGVILRTYFDIQKTIPDLRPGGRIQCDTVNNFIIQYRLLENE